MKNCVEWFSLPNIVLDWTLSNLSNIVRYLWRSPNRTYQGSGHSLWRSPLCGSYLRIVTGLGFNIPMVLASWGRGCIVTVRSNLNSELSRRLIPRVRRDPSRDHIIWYQSWTLDSGSHVFLFSLIFMFIIESHKNHPYPIFVIWVFVFSFSCSSCQ